MIVLFFGLTLILLIPAFPGHLFDGIPLNQGVELFIVILLVLNGVTIAFKWLGHELPIRNSWLRVESWFVHRYRFVGFILVVAIVAKLSSGILSKFYPENILSLCYETQSAKFRGKCIPSADNLFKFGTGSLTTREAAWDGNATSNLWYLNGGYGALDEKGFYNLSTDEVWVRLAGRIVPSPTGEYRLNHTGEIDLKIGDTHLADSEHSVPIEIRVLAKRGSQFELQSWTGEHWRKAESAPVNPWIEFVETVLRVFFGSVLVLAGFLLLIRFLMHLENTPVLWGMALLLLTSAFLPKAGFVGMRLLLVTAFLGALGERAWGGRVRVMNWLLFLLAGCFFFVGQTVGFDAIRFQGPGDDGSAYDFVTRAMLTSGSVFEFLRGTEDVFLYQGGFRYLHAIPMALFGEHNTCIIFFAITFLFWSSWGLVVWLQGEGGPHAASILLGVLSLAQLSHIGIYLALANLSEPVAFIGLITGALLGLDLLREPSATDRVKFLAASFSFAIAVFSRANVLPGAALFYLYLCYQMNRRGNGWALVSGVSLFLGTVFFPMIHNFYFGNMFVFNSRAVTPNMPVPPQELLRGLFAGFSETQVSKLLTQLKHLFVIGDLTVPLHGLSRLLYQGLMCGFLGSILWALFNGYGLRVLGAIGPPLLLWSVHLCAIVTTYYPRFIAISYFFFGISAIYLIQKVYVRSPKKSDTSPDYLTYAPTSSL